MHSFSCPALVTWIGFASQFCNSYLRSAPSSGGMVSLGGFVVFWGWIFVLTTVAVWLGKKEVPDGARKEEGGDYGMVDSAERGDPAEEAEPNLGVAGTYRAMWLVLHKPAVRSLCVILLTCKVRTAPAAANRRRRPLPPPLPTAAESIQIPRSLARAPQHPAHRPEPPRHPSHLREAFSRRHKPLLSQGRAGRIETANQTQSPARSRLRRRCRRLAGRRRLTRAA